jgi:uncharacterized protein (TIGR01777 family)
MNVTITGATGFIGRRLVRRLIDQKHSLHLLVRSPRPGLPPGVKWSVWNSPGDDPPAAALDGADAIVHLAGEPVAQRWTAEAKRRIRDSRVDGTKRLARALAGISARPKVLVCASAVGFYGVRGEEALDESSPPGHGFLPEVCLEWEQAADAAVESGVRVVKIRTGVALGPEGGALARMLLPLRMGVGGRLGDGRQWMSWIHIEDLVSLFVFALERTEARGAFNGVAPNPARNAEFTVALASVLRRAALLPVPTLGLRLLFGEMAEVLLGSQQVFPRAPLAAGFVFRFPELGPALRDLLA